MCMRTCVEARSQRFLPSLRRNRLNREESEGALLAHGASPRVSGGILGAKGQEIIPGEGTVMKRNIMHKSSRIAREDQRERLGDFPSSMTASQDWSMAEEQAEPIAQSQKSYRGCEMSQGKGS